MTIRQRPPLLDTGKSYKIFFGDDADAENASANARSQYVTTPNAGLIIFSLLILLFFFVVIHKKRNNNNY